ncbi:MULTISPECIES: thermonuclease family protein [unclassified Gammaproteobacteria]|uniref:thermonuclease family protein n=1 Tax=unclassified Gammaproteobacteria TaxID=33811 RepID=UPI0021E14724|nr:MULTISPECIES: thermonuclease family protein [unclassified Gammaproteobacteria]
MSSCDRTVESGAAWVYQKYTSDPILYEAEEAAKENKRGLWALPDPLPPWEWRKRK